MPKKPIKQPTLKIEDFHYLDERAVSMPQIVLGIKVYRECFSTDYPPRRHTFVNGAPKFQNIVHQTSGIGCGQFYVTGTFLQPKSAEILSALKEIEKKWLDSNIGALGGATLEQLNDYESDLQRLFGASANHSHRDFCEGLYPIDLRYLPRIAAEHPDMDHLDDLIEWDSGLSRAMGSVGRWGAWILGTNSD